MRARDHSCTCNIRSARTLGPTVRDEALADWELMRVVFLHLMASEGEGESDVSNYAVICWAHGYSYGKIYNMAVSSLRCRQQGAVRVLTLSEVFLR